MLDVNPSDQEYWLFFDRLKTIKTLRHGRMAPDSPILASPIPSSRPTYSCVRCADRKVRCDRQNPCSACLRHDVQCVFRAPPPPRRKQKRAQDGNLKDRLKRYEALFQNLGVDPNGVGTSSQAEQRRRTIIGSEIDMMEGEVPLPTPASTATEPERSITTSQVLHGQGRSKVVDK